MLPYEVALPILAVNDRTSKVINYSCSDASTNLGPHWAVRATLIRWFVICILIASIWTGPLFTADPRHALVDPFSLFSPWQVLFHNSVVCFVASHDQNRAATTLNCPSSDSGTCQQSQHLTRVKRRAHSRGRDVRISGASTSHFS
ncbi:hypothetical protein M433DRAFT_153560 [Acidomyces richmondensis BFW]|nr:MAG: hypothetical protein FE78DRAFT_89247 [Acidomyces sp. 'richmondensis']KYG46300.1 hypothetical protein M433DRAFT_153560 [Acidomyces richmondensis BFW]